jgi:hypothetical protein
LERTTLDRAVKVVLELVMDAGSWTVDEDRILRRYRELDVHVASIDDIRKRLSLEEMDRRAVGLAKGYRWSAVGEGVAAGEGGRHRDCKEEPGCRGRSGCGGRLACRAAAHHAAVYGYRVDAPVDRDIALKVLGGATSSDLAAKEATFAELNAIALMVARRKTWDELRQKAWSRA